MGEQVDKAKGNIKKAGGTVTGNDDLKREGQRDVANGNATGACNEVENEAKDMRKPQKRGRR